MYHTLSIHQRFKSIPYAMRSAQMWVFSIYYICIGVQFAIIKQWCPVRKPCKTVGAYWTPFLLVESYNVLTTWIVVPFKHNWCDWATGRFMENQLWQGCLCCSFYNEQTSSFRQNVMFPLYMFLLLHCRRREIMPVLPNLYTQLFIAIIFIAYRVNNCAWENGWVINLPNLYQHFISKFSHYLEPCWDSFGSICERMRWPCSCWKCLA